MTYPTVALALSRVPERFKDDGLSGGFPDWLYRRWLKGVGRVHDHGYCSRCHKPALMNPRQQNWLDHQLKAHARERLPWWLNLAPLALLAGTRIGGHRSFDTCYAVEPKDATSEQLAAGLCRHDMPVS